jgi:hypothetical protein
MPSDGTHATAYVPESLGDCPHATRATPGQTDVVPGIDVLFAKAAMSHSCGVPSGPLHGARISYHLFKSTAEMDAAFSEAIHDHIGMSSMSCEASIGDGWGPYDFDDGRKGTAACLLEAGASNWIVWTEESTGVVTTLYVTATDQATQAALADYWKTEAGPVPGG